MFSSHLRSLPLSPLLLFLVLIVVRRTQCQNDTTFEPIVSSTDTTSFFTTDVIEECSALSSYVFMETDSNFSKVLLSDRVNFAPYIYKVLNQRVSLFPSTADVNPCNASFVDSSFDGTIVLIHYNAKVANFGCNAQQWTLNMQNMGAAGVLIGSNDLSQYVYVLDGDHALADPQIPTRMISAFDAQQITARLSTNTSNTSSSADTGVAVNVWISFDCFANATSFPSVVCISDNSANGQLVFVDGEYQRQADIEHNAHPIWYKRGTGGLNLDLYLFLEIDHNDGWWWLIFPDYRTLAYNESLSDSSALLLNPNVLYCNSTRAVNPVQCDHWYYQHAHQSFVHSSAESCELGDTHVCIESDNTYMGDVIGSYRQLHPGVQYFVKELIGSASANVDLYLRLTYVANQYSWAILSPLGYEAYCLLGTSDFGSIPLEPWTCIGWYSWFFNGYFSDGSFDVDEHFCGYSATQNITYTYPSSFCVMDYSIGDGNYAQHQFLFGEYVLDTNLVFDERHIYSNSRMHALQLRFQWYESFDVWLLISVADNTLVAVCEQDVFTPDLCTALCWDVRDNIEGQTYSDCQISILSDYQNCSLRTYDNDEQSRLLSSLNNNSNHSNSTSIDIDFICVQWQSSSYGFAGNGESNAVFTRSASDALVNNRSYWYYASPLTPTTYYLYFDFDALYWVFSTALDTRLAWCLLYDELSPLLCQQWFTQQPIQNCNSNRCIAWADLQPCTKAPTYQPTTQPTSYPTSNPTHPTVYPTFTPSNPTTNPTTTTSMSPTLYPTTQPTRFPTTGDPTKKPNPGRLGKGQTNGKAQNAAAAKQESETALILGIVFGILGALICCVIIARLIYVYNWKKRGSGSADHRGNHDVVVVEPVQHAFPFPFPDNSDHRNMNMSMNRSVDVAVPQHTDEGARPETNVEMVAADNFNAEENRNPFEDDGDEDEREATDMGMGGANLEENPFEDGDGDEDGDEDEDEDVDNLLSEINTADGDNAGETPSHWIGFDENTN